MMLLRDLAQRAPEWDASVKASLILALVLFCLLMALGIGGPPAVQLPARIGAFGVLVSGQLLFLWGNRREISPYHQAQQHFIAGRFQSAISILEANQGSLRESVDALVLLGNCYRHLAQYDASRAVLERALALDSRHHLAHFSLGKLRLVSGDYAAARESIARALELGAPGIVYFELGQARYLLGETETARRHFVDAQAALRDEPAQLLLLSYYLHRSGAAERPQAGLIRAGLDSCRADAAKYSGTDYGAHLSRVAEQLEQWLTAA